MLSASSNLVVATHILHKDDCHSKCLCTYLHRHAQWTWNRVVFMSHPPTKLKRSADQAGSKICSRSRVAWSMRRVASFCPCETLPRMMEWNSKRKQTSRCQTLPRAGEHKRQEMGRVEGALHGLRHIAQAQPLFSS